MMFSELKSKWKDVESRNILSLIDRQRVNNFSIKKDGLFFDYSKTNIDENTLGLLLDLIKKSSFHEKREAMFSGKKINITEDRAVLHTALRAEKGPILMDGKDVMPAVLDTRFRMLNFAESVRNGEIQGEGGRYTDVINIGIGGSDLGPSMAYLALRPYANGPKCHFVSNVDGAHINDVLEGLNPTTTLVIVASKTFITIETLTNAQTALDWMAKKVARPADSFVALSSSMGRTAEFGISANRVFSFEDWVGGRYSLWGPIGLSLAIALGRDDWLSFLDGAASMDHHFIATPDRDNICIILALIGIWHAQIGGHATRAVLPYEQRLERLPAYLQQLEMESNGKAVKIDGSDVEITTAPVVWGASGTNGQHAFYQLIHQGTQIIPCEFLVGKQGHEPDLCHQHRLLQANCLAQSQALMVGRNLDDARKIASLKGFVGDELERQARHRVFKGNRPSTTLVYDKLTPACLGQIIALYEHRVFVEGVILDINSFDQWGVELGKELATALGPVLMGEDAGEGNDASTEHLVQMLRSNK